MNLYTCQFVVWGFKNNRYNTFSHIHEAFYRALKHMGKRVSWYDAADDTQALDFSNAVFISMEHGIDGMPRCSDAFYIIHNAEKKTKEYLNGYPILNYGVYTNTTKVPSTAIEFAKDTFITQDTVLFRWGTNLLPHEIEANKPRTLVRNSDKAVFVGTAIAELRLFSKACVENRIDFQVHRNVTLKENVRLVQESYMAPALNIPWQTQNGYIPCRIFKNISYGHLGMTNNKAVYDYFGGQVAYSSSPYHLFYEAKERLIHENIETQHRLMDDIAKNHTYLNKIDALLHAVRMQ